MTLQPSDPAEALRKQREWRARSVQRYQDRLREEGGKFRTIGSNPQRKAREFERAYGGEERVEWIRGLPCVFCGRTPSQNAHIKTGGKGRKSDAEYVVPACGDRPGPHGIVRGCHWEMDDGIGKAAMERKYRVDLAAEAERIAKEWEER